jgi:hypothetical protein
MEFNIANCIFMHVGKRNPRYSYYMNGIKLQTTEEEVDVGITVLSSLKPGKHCDKAANRATAVLKIILRT